jgi:biotin transport system substrate-specific component
MTYPTYADIFLPARKNQALFYNLILIMTGSILITLSAKISIPLPFSPIPITMQTFAVLFIGALLGSKRGSLTVLAYIS